MQSIMQSRVSMHWRFCCAFILFSSSCIAMPMARLAPIHATTAITASAATEAALIPPRDRGQMLEQAACAVHAAQDAGKTRFILRLFLPRGDDAALVPPDESWQGGIMQLYAACSPLVRELLRRLSTEIAGVPPALTEQRLDASGVDGEAVWFAQSARPQDDAVGLVQPSAERMDQIRQLSADAGSRPLLLVNPQWKERDDPLDALSRRGGLLGALGNVLGGKAAMEAELDELGYVSVYTLAEYVCRGSRICLHLAFPHGWTASYRNSETSATWVPLFSGASTRPTYQEIEEALKAADVPLISGASTRPTYQEIEEALK